MRGSFSVWAVLPFTAHFAMHNPDPGTSNCVATTGIDPPLAGLRPLVLIALALWPTRALAPAPVYFDLVGTILWTLGWMLALLVFGVASFRRGARTARWILLGLLAMPVLMIIGLFIGDGIEKQQSERARNVYDEAFLQLCESASNTSTVLVAGEPSDRPAAVLIEYAEGLLGADGIVRGDVQVPLAWRFAEAMASQASLCESSRVREFQQVWRFEGQAPWFPVCRPESESIGQRQPSEETEYRLILGRRHSVHSLPPLGFGTNTAALFSAELFEGRTGRKLADASFCFAHLSTERGRALMAVRFADFSRLIGQAVPLRAGRQASAPK